MRHLQSFSVWRFARWPAPLGDAPTITKAKMRRQIDGHEAGPLSRRRGGKNIEFRLGLTGLLVKGSCAVKWPIWMQDDTGVVM
jgi:hypothetical protein